MVTKYIINVSIAISIHY